MLPHVSTTPITPDLRARFSRVWVAKLLSKVRCGTWAQVPSPSQETRPSVCHRVWAELWYESPRGRRLPGRISPGQPASRCRSGERGLQMHCGTDAEHSPEC